LQRRLSLEDAEVERLAGYAREILKHYRNPRDIEWAIDREGKLFFLQCRPLRVMECGARQTEMDTRGLQVAARGTTVCPGAGGGRIYQVRTSADLEGIPDGVVLAAAHPFPGLVTVMGRVAALVTEVGGTASHTATLAREFGVPTLAGVAGASEMAAGMMVTVDATDGVIYEGFCEELINARRREGKTFAHTAIYDMLRGLLSDISPLTMIDPSSSEFRAENCRTLHDITRYAHQKGMEEMFDSARLAGSGKGASRRLRSVIPLQVEVIYLDKELPVGGERGWVAEEELESPPMQAFWGGIREQGWHNVLTNDTNGQGGSMATGVADGERNDFSTFSQAILSREYMVLSLRMGYHLTTIEAMCSDAPGKNYVRMQQKGGGASRERRMWRVKLLGDILAALGFDNQSEGDFLDAIFPYQECRVNLDMLKQLGKVTILTKQLDMALSNEAMVEWYGDDIKRKLGLGKYQVSSDK
jgi:pyruvate,water dikinase